MAAVISFALACHNDGDKYLAAAAAAARWVFCWNLAAKVHFVGVVVVSVAITAITAAAAATCDRLARRRPKLLFFASSRREELLCGAETGGDLSLAGIGVGDLILE